MERRDEEGCKRAGYLSDLIFLVLKQSLFVTVEIRRSDEENSGSFTSDFDGFLFPFIQSKIRMSALGVMSSILLCPICMILEYFHLWIL